MPTNKERLLSTLRGEIPDCVPVAPDFSNMIPAQLTGKPFWDLYLYKDPPIWEAYIECAKHFDIDAVMDGYFPLAFPDERNPEDEGFEPYIVKREENLLVVQHGRREDGKMRWKPRVDCYYRVNPPTFCVDPAKIGLPETPEEHEPVEGIRPVDYGPEGLRRVKELMGDQGLVGVFLTNTIVTGTEEQIMDFMMLSEDEKLALRDQRIAAMDRRFDNILAMDVQPDFLCVGGSGTLVTQTPDTFRNIAFPAVKRGIEKASAHGYMTHVHSCGLESLLVKIFAEETDLTVIDPLEVPPMGDCNLAELKKLYGGKITLKGNLHTTRVMLQGTPETVREASRRAIDDAAADGRFILSTGDQCGRDTPDENLHAMVETARTYGRY